jgi:hypothetical protein
MKTVFIILQLFLVNIVFSQTYTTSDRKFKLILNKNTATVKWENSYGDVITKYSTYVGEEPSYLFGVQVGSKSKYKVNGEEDYFLISPNKERDMMCINYYNELGNAYWTVENGQKCLFNY